MKFNKLKEQRLLFVSVFFLVLLSFPFLKIANKAEKAFGIPILYLYVFVVWFLSILSIFLIIEFSKRKIKK